MTQKTIDRDKLIKHLWEQIHMADSMYRSIAKESGDTNNFQIGECFGNSRMARSIQYHIIMGHLDTDTPQEVK